MSTAIESALYLSAVLISTVLVLAGVLSLSACVWISLSLYIGLLCIAWRRFNGGRHPCFLFLGMLLLFQMGRLIGYALGAIEDPFSIVVQTAMPFNVSTSSAELTLLIIVLSSTCIYFVCAWNVPDITLPIGWEQRWLPAMYVLFGLTFPFVLYKNYQYLSYIRSHGGYLAIFTDSQAILESAGAVVRLMSLVSSNAFILVFLMERKRGRLAAVTSLFLLTSALELAIGLRGKVFLFLITLWFLRNLKTGKGFKPLTLALVGAGGSMAAILIAGFREMRTTAITGPADFIAGQGISMGVTELAIEYEHLFQPRVATYMFNELLSGFFSGSHFGEGQLFDNDLSIFLNPSAYKMGFGTGSSYLAEAYLLGGVAAVIVASLLIGFVLRGLHVLSKSFAGAVIVALLLPSVIYMPRAELLAPLATILKSGLTFLFMLPCLWAIRFLFYSPAALRESDTLPARPSSAPQ